MLPDVCVVGAGAAGLALARDLAQRGRSVVLVEGDGAGGTRHPVDAAGLPHRGSTDGHAFALGGTTTLWGGQLWPWEPYEFGRRPHIEAWPLDPDSVARFYDGALDVLGVPPGPFDARLARARGIRLPALDAERFAYKYSKWAGWRSRNLGRTLGRELLRHPAAEVVLGERAVRVETEPDGAHVTGVRLRGRGGAERVVRARTYVVAGGVLGTVRLLLASGGAGGLGSGAGWLGRGFMDHLSVRMGRFEPRDRGRFEGAFAPFYTRGTLHTPRIVARPELLDAHDLLGVYGHWEPELPADAGLSIVREGLRSVQAGRRPRLSRADLGRLAADVPDVARIAYGIGVRRRRPFPRRSRFHLRVDVEQLPASTLSLARAGRDDERLVLDWRVPEAEERTARRFAGLLADELDRLGVGTFTPHPAPFGPEAWGDGAADAYHMMGGTRMSADAAGGVVDADGRVWGVENLYVTGASVFPSGGMANPTLTILALALRLGRHLDRSAL